MKFNATPTFYRTMNVDKRIVCYRGSTRSGKSYAMMQKVVVWLWTGRISGKVVSTGTFSVTRSTMPSLKATVLNDFISFLHEKGIYQYITHIKTTHEFIFKGRKVVFFSLDDEHKLRGKQHDFIWINECTDTSFKIFNQAIMRLNHQMFLDYNPDSSPWVKTEIEEKRLIERDDVHLDISTYKDNLFLPDLLVKEIEELVLVDENLYQIYALGNWATLQGLICPNFTVIKEMPTEGKVYWGLDFGYIHATSVVKVIKTSNGLYIDNVIHESGLLIDEIASRLKECMLPHERIYCDSAEPRSIEHLKRLGILAKPAKKGADSVRQGIDFIKQHHVYITEDSVKAISQLKKYKWAEDKNGDLMDAPIKLYDDFYDSLRYALNKALGTKLRFI